MPSNHFTNAWKKKAGINRKQFDMFFDKMLDGFAYHKIVIDNSGKPVDYVFLEVNLAFEKLTGLKKQQIIGKKVTSALPGIEKDPADWIGVYGRVALTGEPVQFENHAKTLGKWFKISAYCPEKGYFVAIFEDITERKKTERKLELINEELEERVRKRTEEVSKERQRLYTILETLPAYVVLLDKDYQVTFANKIFRQRFGESHGKRCYEYLFKLNSPCENCETYKVLKNNAPHHWEWTGPDGRDYDIYDFPFFDTNGSTIILEMGIDITERKKMEKQLKDSERLAAIGLTAGMVGHDIRNPLQAITGEIYLAKTELDPQPDSDAKKNVLESLQEIENNVDYINKIVADLQDFSRPLNPRIEGIDLKSIIDKLLEKNGLPNNIDLKVRVDATAKKAVSDSTFINRILHNLVNNSVQAMPKGGKLSIVANKEANDLVITVEDTGVGVPEAAKNKLFTPMFTTKAKGQGLGLAVIKRMTEAMGGTITFESQKDKGTTFTIRLPQKKLNAKINQK